MTKWIIFSETLQSQFGNQANTLILRKLWQQKWHLLIQVQAEIYLADKLNRTPSIISFTVSSEIRN